MNKRWLGNELEEPAVANKVLFQCMCEGAEENRENVNQCEVTDGHSKHASAEYEA